ncbi:hypothetical protein SNEBB_010778 [Seison nebaliae]|nr:hypothetical protein SNEBB_010778 [Seison nebaliae]
MGIIDQIKRLEKEEYELGPWYEMTDHKSNMVTTVVRLEWNQTNDKEENRTWNRPEDRRADEIRINQMHIWPKFKTTAKFGQDKPVTVWTTEPKEKKGREESGDKRRRTDGEEDVIPSKQ